MTEVAGRLRRWLTGRGALLAGCGAVWLVLLLGVAMPQWRLVQRQHVEIKKLERQFADLDRWTVAGLWLEPMLAAREPEVAITWARLFPDARDREQLFLALAEVADLSGVDAFHLEELGIYELGWAGPDDGSWGQEVDAVETDLDPDAQAVVEVSVEPAFYHVRAAFAGDYARVASFLSHLARLERAVGVRTLAIRPSRTGLEVQLELKIYVNQPFAT